MAGYTAGYTPAERKAGKINKQLEKKKKPTQSCVKTFSFRKIRKKGKKLRLEKVSFPVGVMCECVLEAVWGK